MNRVLNQGAQTMEGEPRRSGEIDPRLLEILVCPLSKATLEWRPESRELISWPARLAFPVRDGVPIMLPEEARALDPDE
ncbi:Trm112 family protein [Oryzibacter oryziterrae]|uniref:Trm112 family protein n=1 Tax=Oryzibacter oryziterrae TaxID=2766474 RepID=UPI0036F2EA34